MWARAGATTFVPHDHLPAPTQATRGAPFAAINDDIDESPGSRQTTILGFTVNAVKRLVNRIVPTWARSGDTTQIPADKLANASVAAGGGLNQTAVDGRIATLVEDWAEVSDTSSVIPQGLYRPITVAATLPTPNQALGSQLYGTGSSHADRVYWPKRIADRKTVTLRAAFLTEARGDAAIVGWQASPEIGRVRPPWGVLLGVTRFVIEPSGGGSSWRISMSGGSGLAHPTGLIISGVGTQTITLFRRAGTPNDSPVYDSVNTSTTRQLVAGATYSIQIRYSGGQNFFNVHDSDYLEGIASEEDVYDVSARIAGLESNVASLAAGGGGLVLVAEAVFTGITGVIAASHAVAGQSALVLGDFVLVQCVAVDSNGAPLASGWNEPFVVGSEVYFDWTITTGSSVYCALFATGTPGEISINVTPPTSNPTTANYRFRVYRIA